MPIESFLLRPLSLFALPLKFVYLGGREFRHQLLVSGHYLGITRNVSLVKFAIKDGEGKSVVAPRAVLLRKRAVVGVSEPRRTQVAGPTSDAFGPEKFYEIVCRLWPKLSVNRVNEFGAQEQKATCLVEPSVLVYIAYLISLGFRAARIETR